MRITRALLSVLIMAHVLSVHGQDTYATTAQNQDNVKIAMHRATHYMMDVASYNGGFVWNYLPDYSRQWGELEARRTMVWLQSPGTPDVGQVLLDAYHATGDEYYYESARCVALCIIQGQLPCGGWNYMFDMEPEDSLRQWYNTVGRQAWRMEEFQHYYGNATFDDDATMHCAEFLLRIYLEKHEEAFLKPLENAIQFFLDSQYDNGGWPQRYPLMYDHPFKGKEDYSSFITINDNVMAGNIDFLLQCYTSLGMEKLKQPILKAMYLLRDLQQPEPCAGWADQYTPNDLQPAHARSYEPRSINTGTTVSMIRKMIEFYMLTGDKSFLQRLPQAITFLDKVELPRQLAARVRRTPLQDGEMLLPRFIDPERRQPLYVHRKGSNVANGEYYTSQEPEGTIGHYSSFMVVNLDLLKQMVADAERLVQKDLQRNSPLLHAAESGPVEYYYGNIGRRFPANADSIASALNSEGYWLTPLRQVSNPWKPLPRQMQSSDANDWATTMVGDEYDTSPYENYDVKGISTRTYIYNMVAMMQSLRPDTKTLSGLYPERFNSTVEGKKTSLHVLRNGGIEACVTNYGARLVSLMVPDKVGELQDVVLGFDNIGDYHQRKQNFGSTVGRYIGRIKGAEFTLDGKKWQLQKTGGGNISHGGYPGFADKVWDVVMANDSILKMKLVSPDGDNGFPGTLTVFATYHLTAGNELKVDYEATTDKPTVVNISNHTFFNISGNPKSDVLSQQLFIDSKYIATYDKDKNLDGQFLKVKNTPFDFTTAKAIGSDIDIYDEQMSITKGYDHSFVLRHDCSAQRPAAVVYDENSGREMSVYTTQPVVHVYTANGLNGSLVGKNGVAYDKCSAICLETMHLADSPNQSQFPSTVLRPGETYHQQTVFHFTGRTSKRRNLQSQLLLYGSAASLSGLGVVGIMSLIK